EIADILAERTQPDMRVRYIVALAEFDEPAERPHAGETAFHRLSGKTVENDVNAFRTNPPEVVDEAQRAGIEHVLDPKRIEKTSLGRRPSGRNDVGPAGLRD